jgi:hypothetical protein
MLGSAVGVAESIRVYYKPPSERPDMHVLEIEWVDPSHQVHNSRVVCHTEHLRAPTRSAYLAGETIPGVGQVLLDCPVLKEPTDEPKFNARLLRGVNDTIDIPVLVEVDEEDFDFDEC